MSEEGASQEAELWIRYLKGGMQKWILDFSALRKLCLRVQKLPELNEMHAVMIADLFEASSEAEAVLSLAVAGAVVGYCRLYSKDSSDADFLSRLLKFAVPKFEVNLTKGWSSYQDALTMSLLEWKQTYRIDSSLNSTLRRLIQPKDRSSLRDAHYTVIADVEAVEALLRRTPSEYVTLGLLRVWEHTMCPAPEAKDALSALLLPTWSGEGSDILLDLLRRHLKSLSQSSSSVLFRTAQDKFTVLLINYVKTHSAVFVESSVGASVRVLAGRSVQSPKDLLQSPVFRADMEQLFTFLKYTVENLHKLCAPLARFLCILCEAITEVKGQADYWHELSSLLVLRVLAPAVSNPVASGLTDTCGSIAMNVLKETARLLHYVWLGKSVESGELSEIPWVNEVIPQWNSELRSAYAAMLVARKVQQTPLLLPRAMVVVDLADLTRAFQSVGVSLTRSLASPDIVKVKGKQLKPPLAGKKRESEDTHESPKEIPEMLEDEPVPVISTPSRPLEESTPSVMALPLPQVRSTAVCEVQTESSYVSHTETQTLPRDRSIKATQTKIEIKTSESVQTDPESERFKLRHRSQEDELVKNQGCQTVGSWDTVAADKIQAEKELIMLQQYRSNEALRSQSLTDYWSAQLSELTLENDSLRKSIRDLRYQIANYREVTEEDLMNERASQFELQDTMRSQVEESTFRRLSPGYAFLRRR